MTFKIAILTLTLAASSALAVSTAMAAGDSAKGGELARAKCAICHGPAGQGVGPNPKLAGHDAAFIETQLKAFQTGARQHAMMSGIAKKLSEQEVADLAAFYATLPAK